MPMTQQYRCGELASRLARLEGAAAGQVSGSAVGQLRSDAESTHPFGLCHIASQALQVADALCWDALERGDLSTFANEAAIAADLHEFATCARLLDEE
jgi:hypothetical protein